MAVLCLLLAASYPAAALRLSLQLNGPAIEQELQGQHVKLPVSGHLVLIEEGGTASAELSAIVDLADLQSKIAPIVQATGSQHDECGDRIDVGSVTLEPAGSVARLTVDVHYEKWDCRDVLGISMKNRLFQQNGNIAIALTPRIEGGQTIALSAEVVAVNADDGLLRGLLGDALLGPSFRRLVVDALQGSLNPDLRVSLPGELASYHPVFTSVAFAGQGGRLSLQAAGRLDLSAEQIRSFLAGPAEKAGKE
jgi:hypothetical protein